VQAKLTTPRTVDAAVSPALQQHFESCLQRRLTVVSAPAGYGKTTVTVAALRTLHLQHVWYRVDVLDHDPAVTVLSLCEALRRRRATFGAPLIERLLHPSESPLSVEGMAAAFVIAAQEEGPAEVHLVIDDYHEATGSDEFNRLIGYLIDNLPDGWRLIVLGRYEPGFATARLRVRGQLGFITADELRLDVPQAHELLLRHLPQAGHPQAERLIALTEGWPAAVTLAVEALAGRDIAAVDEVLADPRLTGDIYAYMAEQVYRQESPEARLFLRRTCDLDALTPEIAARIADVAEAHRHLEHLARNRIFTAKVPETGAYRYHPLFRDYLRETCLLEDGPDACRRRRLHTAAVLEECREIEHSVELLIAAGEPELALGVIARQGEAAFGRHRAETLDAWLARLPVTLVESHPWAQLLSAHRETRGGRYEEALRHIEAAARTFRGSGDGHGLYSALSAKERALFWRGDPQAALEACRGALSVAESDGQRLHTYASMLSAAVDMGDWSTAEAAQRESEALTASGPPEELLRIRALHSHALYVRGRLRESYRVSEAIDAGVLPAYLQPTVLGARSTVAYGLARYLESQSLGMAALESAQQTGHEMVTGYCRDTLGFVRVLKDEDSAGLEEVESARRTFFRLGDEAAAAWPTMHTGTYHRRHGSLQQAISCYSEAVRLTAGKRDALARHNARVNLTFTLGLDGDPGACTKLRGLEQDAARLSLEFVRHKAAFFRGCLDLRKGRDDSAVSTLRAAVAAQVELGHLSFLGRELLTQADVAQRLLAEVDEESVFAETIDAMARHTGSRPSLVAAARLGQSQATAVLRAADRWYAQGDRTIVVRSVLKLGFRRARERAAEMLTPTPSSPDDRVRLAYDLTRREAQVLRLISDGLSNQDIEATLHVSQGTVKTHVNHIFRKLEATDRVTAVLRYKEAVSRHD
jgi:ATP/maltotriose-dependent transcriptional regulator MalT